MNKTEKIYKAILGFAFLCIPAAIIMLFLGYDSEVGLLITGFFILLAIGIRGVEITKGFSFTIWVFAAASAGMFYPDYITDIGGYNTKGLIVPLVQLIMFGMGTAMSVQDFVGVIKMPKAVFIGLVCQFAIMPVIGFILAITFPFPAEIAAGVILIGSSPSGVASNVMTFLARGNLALSITLTTCATLIAPVVTPFLMQTLAGQLVPIVFLDMMISIINIVILPVLAGLLFNRVFRGKARWLHDAMPVISMTGIVVILGIMIAVGRDNLITIGMLLLLACIIHNAAGYFLGYWGCRMFRLDKKSCRTIAIEVGLQNGGLASGIAATMGKVATMGLAPILFGTWMDISGSFLANWWRDRPVSGDEVTGDKVIREIVTEKYS